MKMIQSVACLGLILNQFIGIHAFYDNRTDVVISLPTGEHLVLDVLPEDTFLDVMSKAENLTGLKKATTYFLDYSHEPLATLSVATEETASFRNYHAPITAKERQDIYYVVTTLGKASPGKLLTETSTLEKAGNRLKHLHPFKFLTCIFTNEEMKVGVLQIRSKMISRIPKKFFGGLFESLSEEAAKDNLKPEYIKDFAKALQIEPSLISKPIEERKWKELINVLVEQLPRSSNPNRYDM